MLVPFFVVSGENTTLIVALAHYLWGNGTERSVNIANIGLKISPMKINQIKDIIKSGVVGTFPVSTKFTHATGDYNVITGAYLGLVTITVPEYVFKLRSLIYESYLRQFSVSSS